VAEKRGLVMVNFFSYFLTCSNHSTLNDVVNHINHIRNVAGIDSVGIGASYDGINEVPVGLPDVGHYPELFVALLDSGTWDVDDLKKLAGFNFLRVLAEVEQVADTLNVVTS
jgi:membrane dipeptidase